MRLHTGTLMLTAFLFVPSVHADQTVRPDTLTIGTASPGGTYYPYGKGLAALLTKHVGLTFFDQPTQGTTQNVLLLARHEAVLGLTTMGVALHAWNGDGWANGNQYHSIRALFPMFDSPFQFVAPKRLHLGSLAGFAGKRIGDGPKAGTGGTYMPGIFKTLDIEVVLHNGAWEANMEQVASGELDGLAAFAGIPMPGLAQLDAKEPLEYLQPLPDQIAKVKGDFLELTPSLISAGTYPSLTTDYRTFGLFNFAIVNQDLPDDLAYKIVKAVFEHHQELVDAHPAAKETIPANVDRDTFLPFHPGAVRYYREIGVDIPAALAGTHSDK
jgi:TRAP transporter TAXI family solute receptor